VEAPGVGKVCYERTVDHVPKLLVVLQLLIDDLVQERAAFTHGVASEFGEDIRNGYIVLVADPFDVLNDLLDLVFVVVLEGERRLDGKSAADVDRIERVADLFQFTVLEDEAAEFTPVICRIVDTGVDKEVQHPEFRLLAGGNSLLVKRSDVAVTDAEARRVKFELRFFVRCYADAYFVTALDVAFIDVELPHLVEDRDTVMKSFVEKFRDILRIQRHLETVAEDVCILCHESLLHQAADDAYVERGRRFDVDVITQRLFEDERKMGRLRAIGVRVRAVVAKALQGVVESSLYKPDVLADAGKV